MKLHEALRRADPAQHLPRAGIDDEAEQLLHRIVHSGTEGAHAEGVMRRRPARGRMPAVVTMLVAVCVVAGAVVVISAARPGPVGAAGPDVALPAGATVLEDAVFARFEEAAGGAPVPRDQPSLTWTPGHPSAVGGPIDLAGRTAFLAAACDGGGAIAVRISGRPDIPLDCTHLGALGPVDLTELAKDAGGGSLGLDVITTAGRPRYLVKQIALSSTEISTGPTAAASATPCDASELRYAFDPKGTVMGYIQQPLLITNTARTACRVTGSIELELARDGHRYTAVALPVDQLPTEVLMPGRGLALQYVASPPDDQIVHRPYTANAWLKIDGRTVRLPGRLPDNATRRVRLFANQN